MMSPGQHALASAMSELARHPEAAAALDLSAVVHDLVYDPDELTETDSDAVRQVSAPIFGPDAAVSVALALYDFGKRSTPLLAELDELLRATRLATELTGGRHPAARDADLSPRMS